MDTQSGVFPLANPARRYTSNETYVLPRNTSAMIAQPLQWTDRVGVPHRLLLAHELSTWERELLTILRRQTEIAVLLLVAGFRTPAISQAAPNMLRMMLRILLPNVADEAIATFDSTEGNDLLIQWWEVTDATLLSA